MSSHSKKKILFVSYGGGHVNLIIPVVKQLQATGLYDIDVMGLTTARGTLEQHKIPCFSYRDLPISDKAKAYGEKLASELGNHPSVPQEESIAYLGLSYECLVDDLGETKAEETYRSIGRHAFNPVKVLEDVIRRGNYNLVVATNSPKSERASIVAAGNLSVPAVCVVDLFALQEVRWIGEKNYGQKVCVFSEYVKQLMIKAGRKEEDVLVTGNPAFDYLADNTLPEKAKALRKELGWSNDEKVILWCSQLEPDTHPFTKAVGDPSLPNKVLKKITSICEEKEDWKLAVRKHPSEKPLDLAPSATNCSSTDLSSLLVAADLVMTLSSTVAIEAYLLKKPVLTVDMSVFIDDSPFSAMGLSHGVDNLEDLGQAVEEVLNKPVTESVKEGLLPSAGESTSRICDVLTQELNKGLA